jgi:hypothetical protein
MLLFDNTIFKLKFKYELSYVLIPLSFILYVFFPLLRSYILFHIICISIIGIIDTIFNYINNLDILFLIGSLLIHLLMLLVLINFKKYGKINSISILLLLIPNLTILLLPYWPYTLTRNNMIFLYNSIYFILCIIYLNI